MPLLIIVIIISAAVIGFGSQKFLGKDNPVEEVAEDVIEHQLNLPDNSLDLPFVWKDQAD